MLRGRGRASGGSAAATAAVRSHHIDLDRLPNAAKVFYQFPWWIGVDDHDGDGGGDGGDVDTGSFTPTLGKRRGFSRRCDHDLT